MPFALVGPRVRYLVSSCVVGLVMLAIPAPTHAQSYSIDDILSPGFPLSLVSAKAADRIAWVEFERGMRNLYTAAAPDFAPVRLTNFMDDDGHDMAEAQISDDGSVIAFIRGHTPNREGWIANVLSDPRGTERAIWAASTKGGEPWRVVEAWNLALSPDGKWVAYDKDGAIYRAAVNPGTNDSGTVDAAPPLFSVFGDNRDPVWSPDSKKLAFVSVRGDHSYIGIYDTENPGITYLAPGVDRDSSPTWSPDGQRIAFIRRPGLPFGSHADPGEATEAELPDGLLTARFAGGYDWSIWVASVDGGHGGEIWHNAPEDELHGEVREIIWADESILFQAEPDGWRHYYSVSTEHPDEAVLLTPGDGIAEHISLSPDGATLYYATNVDDIDRRHLWKVSTSGGRATQLSRGATIETYPAVLASESHIATLAGDGARSLGVALVPTDGGAPEYITSLPDEYPLAQHIEPEAVTLTAEDGFEFYNQVWVPEDLEPGEKRPALLFIHGGSRRQMLLGYHYMHFYHMSYAMNQYFANKGYIVMSVNYRSGVGYGRDFRNAPGRGGEGNTEYQDVLAAGRYLQSRPDVDVDKLGVWGLSYGGILTAQGLARNSDVFKAGVDLAGVHLRGESISPESLAYTSSAISAVETWTSPVLLMHGDDDRNVPFQQTVGLVQALRAQDVPFELIVFPDDVHDSLVYDRWLYAFGATEEFFDRVMLRGEAIEGEVNRFRR
ncbi:MAG: prolyl oligopeptidase family serine peptidase [Longimicrobiales bacterium]